MTSTHTHSSISYVTERLQANFQLCRWNFCINIRYLPYRRSTIRNLCTFLCMFFFCSSLYFYRSIIRLCTHEAEKSGINAGFSFLVDEFISTCARLSLINKFEKKNPCSSFNTQTPSLNYMRCYDI